MHRFNYFHIVLYTTIESNNDKYNAIYELHFPVEISLPADFQLRKSQKYA